MAEIPQKLFYKIGEVCQYTDTQPYVLRFWESEFPQLAPEKNRNGQRVYRREDVELILKIKKLLYDEEYTIAGARKRLEQEIEARFLDGNSGRGATADARKGARAAKEPLERAVGLPKSAPPKGLPATAPAPIDPPEYGARSGHTDAVEDLMKRLEESSALLRRTEEALRGEEERREACQKRSADVAAKLEGLLARIKDRDRSS